MAATDRTDARQRLLEAALDQLDRLAEGHWRPGAIAQLERKGCSPAQLHFLMVLREMGPQTVGQLAETLRVSLPSASLMVDRLEEHSLAERRRDDQDRRLVHVALTRKGREAAQDATGFRRAKAMKVLSQFSQEELEAMLTVLAAAERVLSRASAQTGER